MTTLQEKLRNQSDPYKLIHYADKAADRLDELEAQLQKFERAMLLTRKALCGDIHNEDNIIDIAQRLVDKRDELEAQAERLGNQKLIDNDCYVALRNQRDELEAQVAELKADAARLDYLDKEASHSNGVRIGCLPGCLRNAIDAAIEAQKGKV